MISYHKITGPLLHLTICLVLLFSASHVWAKEKLFNAEYFTLENGLEIVVIPNNRAPVITHMVWYRVGAADEPRGKSGIAHFLEHLMFKGSLGFGPGEFSKTIRALGGNDNAFTAQDYTAYYQSVAAKHLELVMRMEAGRMRGLSPPLAEVESESKVVMEERRQRTDNNPQARFAEPFNAALYVNHPYGIPVIGWGHEIENLNWLDAKAFYDRHYAPNNAILVVSGDVTGQEVFELAKEIYGPLPSMAVPERQWTSSPDLPVNEHLEMVDPALRQPVIQIAFKAPGFRQDKEASLALQVLEDIMGNGSTSRLYKSLVIQQKIASQAGLYYSGDNWSDGRIQLYAYPMPGITPDKVKAALMDELRTLLQNGVTKDELEDSKTRLQNEALYALDSLTGPAMIVGRALTTGSTLDDIEYWTDDISQVSAKQVQEAAQRYLNPDTERYISGYLLPPDAITDDPLPQEPTQ